MLEGDEEYHTEDKGSRLINILMRELDKMQRLNQEDAKMTEGK